MDTQARFGLLSIGQFAAASRLSQKALRLYDRRGLLAPAHTDPDSGYRYYHAAQLRIAKLILLLRQMDMPLADIGGVLTAKPDEAEQQVKAHRKMLDGRVERARRTVRDVLCLLHDKEDRTMNFEVEARDVPAQMVASITKKVRVDGLSEHICGGIGALEAFAAGQSGAVTGPPFGVYHGPVNQDDDGPMEIAVPVRGAFTATGDIVVRELPAARVACVTVTGAQCDFPAILGAYDAAHDWIQGRGYEPDGPPREIYLGQAGEAMQIAWPFRGEPNPAR